MNQKQAQAELGAAIRIRREALKIAQDTFAASIGMHRTYYWSIERGRRNVTLRVLRRVADGLDVSVWQLLREAGI